MVLEKIRQVYPQLTRSQRKLADFIAGSYQEAAFMTASRLARRLGVNEATVIRFAQRLGYPGYPELIRDVQAVVQEELQTPNEGESAPGVEQPLLMSLGKEVEALQRAVSHVSPALAQQALSLLQGASRILVAGQGEGLHLAGAFAAGLAGLGLDARAVAGEPLSLAPAFAEIGERDMLVGIAVSPGDADLAQAMRMARERGARTLAVAWSTVAPSAQAADLALICSASDLLPLPSFAVAAAFLDALVQALAMADPVRAQRFRQAVDEALRELGSGRPR